MGDDLHRGDSSADPAVLLRLPVQAVLEASQARQGDEEGSEGSRGHAERSDAGKRHEGKGFSYLLLQHIFYFMPMQSFA